MSLQNWWWGRHHEISSSNWISACLDYNLTPIQFINYNWGRKSTGSLDNVLIYYCLILLLNQLLNIFFPPDIHSSKSSSDTLRLMANLHTNCLHLIATATWLDAYMLPKCFHIPLRTLRSSHPSRAPLSPTSCFLGTVLVFQNYTAQPWFRKQLETTKAFISPHKNKYFTVHLIQDIEKNCQRSSTWPEVPKSIACSVRGYIYVWRSREAAKQGCL